MKLRRTSIALIAMVLLAAAPVLRAQALKQVSGDPIVLIRINGLAAVNAKWGAVATKLGLGAISPDIVDPLAMAQRMLMIKEGLDTKSEAVLAIYPPTNSPEPVGLLLLPVTDYKAFLGNMPNVQKEGDLDTFQLPNGVFVFATQRGGFAALSNAREILAAPAAPIELKGLSARLWAERDVVCWVNLKSFGQMALPQIRMVRGMMRNNPAMGNMPGINPRQAAFGMAITGQMMDLMEQFLTQATSLTYAINMSPDALAVTEECEFAEDSLAAKWIAGVKNTDEPLLQGLPAGQFALAGGWVQGSGGVWDMWETIYMPAFKAMNLPPEQDQAIQKWSDSIKGSLLAMRGGSFVLQLPPQQPAEGGMLRGSAVMRGDVKTILANMKIAMEHQQDLTEAMGQPAMSNVKATPAALTVDGVTLDQYKMTFDFDQMAGQPPQVTQLLKSMYGQTMTSYMGMANDSTLLSAMNLDEQQIAKAVAAAKAGASPLSDDPHIKTLASHLPKSRTAEVFISPGPLANLILDAASAAGARVPGKVPADLPPIGMSVGTQASAVRFDLAIPMDVIQSFVSLALQGYMMNMPPPAPRGGL